MREEKNIDVPGTESAFYKLLAHCEDSLHELREEFSAMTDNLSVDMVDGIVPLLHENIGKQNAYTDIMSLLNDELHKINEIQTKAEHDAEWYKAHMENYRKSFFMLCDLIQSLDIPQGVKYFVKQEELRY